MLFTRKWSTALLALTSNNILPFASAAKLVQARAEVHEWVTIDAGGIPHTKTPEVVTENGDVKTVAGAPYILTGTVFTVTSADHVKTITGSPPPSTATATSGAGGQFAVCYNKAGRHGPFCQPYAGSELSVGKTYYVTWDREHFSGASRSEFVNITATFSPGGSIPGWRHKPVLARQGYVPLTIRESFMRGQANQQRVRLTMIYPDDDDTPVEIPGPVVTVVRADISVAAPDEEQPSRPGRKGPHPAAIAVPVVIGLLAFIAGFWCFWRRNKERFILSRIRRRSSQGYGVSKSRTQRMFDDGKDGDIHLQESPVRPSPTERPHPGRNVFQEELRRQETGR